MGACECSLLVPSNSSVNWGARLSAKRDNGARGFWKFKERGEDVKLSLGRFINEFKVKTSL